MLAYFLAILMAITSLILFLNAFISPKTHRRDDFLWSGLGLFYALTLWLCAGRFTGAVLLGQIAVVALTIAFVWENRKLRKVITAESESNELLAGFSLLSVVGQSLAKISQKEKAAPTTTPEAVVAEEKSEAIESKEEESTLTPTEKEAEKAEETTTSETESALPQTEEVDKTPTAEEEISETPAVKEEITTESEKQEEEEFLGSSLVTPSETKATKTNIFSRIFGIFRKSEPEKQEIKPSEKETEVPNQILDKDKTDTLEGDAIAEESDISENIELQTTTTEVEEAKENIELSETPEENVEEEPESELTSSAETIEDVSVSEEEVEVEEENDTSTVAEELETTTEDETISETTSETQVETQTSEDTLEEAQPTVIPEEKEEITINESSSETTAEDVPEDDIIESLSDLFPNQDESPEKETKNNQSD